MKKVLIFSFIFIALCSCGIFFITNYTSPTIKLIGNDTITINIGNKYYDEGAKAKYLGKDISKNIDIKNNIDYDKTGTYKITYSIKLKYINTKQSVTRTINIIDEDYPIITLIDNEVTINQGSSFKDPGYIANDNYDGDITKNVITTNNIDTKTPGEYKVNYSITDSSGNKFETSRKVIVKKTTTTTTTKDPNKDGNTQKVTTKKGTGDGLPILMYHYFYDESNGETGADSNWMEIKDFENQLKYLTENNYYFPTWSEVRDFIDGKITLPSKSIVLTIDDGHKTLFTHAIPLLEKYKVPATAFIITSRSAANKFKKYENDIITFQSHTHDMHQGGCSGGHGGLFRCINYEKGLKDLTTSINILGKSDAIAYPYGDVTENVLKITKAANFKIGVTTKWGQAKKGADPYQLPRIRMSKGMSLSSFKSYIK